MIFLPFYQEVKVDNDQGMAQSERNCTKHQLSTGWRSSRQEAPAPTD